MTCCGRQRTQFQGTGQIPPRVDDRRRQPLARTAIRFEYTGKTGLTVQGPVTGKRYRFDNPGSRLLVDPQDAPSLAAVPHLRRI
jgi:hypothetical protein